MGCCENGQMKGLGHSNGQMNEQMNSNVMAADQRRRRRRDDGGDDVDSGKMG